MKKVIKLPELGKDIKEYVLVAVNKEEGEKVEKGEEENPFSHNDEPGYYKPYRPKPAK